MKTKALAVLVVRQNRETPNKLVCLLHAKSIQIHSPELSRYAMFTSSQVADQHKGLNNDPGVVRSREFEKKT